MLAIIAAILVVLWILGLLTHVAGGLIHLVLVGALILIVLHFVTGGRSST